MLSVVSLHGEPWQIALGASLGLFVAFSPTLGFQMVIAALLATLFNASRAAAIVCVWVTNPLTIPPIYTVTYWVGAHLWPGPEQPVGRVYELLGHVSRDLARHDLWEVFDRFQELFELGFSMYMPMLVGGALVGVLAAALAYLPVLRAVESYRRVRAAAWRFARTGRPEPEER